MKIGLSRGKNGKDLSWEIASRKLELQDKADDKLCFNLSTLPLAAAPVRRHPLLASKLCRRILPWQIFYDCPGISTVAFSVAKLTLAFTTPGTFFKAVCTFSTQEAHDIPLTGTVIRPRSISVFYGLADLLR
jgi:hypothetical protein